MNSFVKKYSLFAALAVSSITLVGCGGVSKPQVQAPAPQVVAQAQGYQAYSPSAVKLAKAEGKDTAVFFHSKTCGSCAKLDANIKQNDASIPADVAIFKADRDTNQALAKEYGVDKYHTVSYLDNTGVRNVKGLFELKNLVAGFDAPAPAAPKKVNGYQTYSAAAVKLASSQGKKTAVFFHGATCGSCAKLDANIQANAASIPADVAIFKADRDTNQALAKEYNVDKYHTVSFLGDAQPKNVKGLFELDKLIGNFN